MDKIENLKTILFGIAFLKTYKPLFVKYILGVSY